MADYLTDHRATRDVEFDIAYEFDVPPPSALAVDQAHEDSHDEWFARLHPLHEPVETRPSVVRRPIKLVGFGKAARVARPLQDSEPHEILSTSNSAPAALIPLREIVSTSSSIPNPKMPPHEQVHPEESASMLENEESKRSFEMGDQKVDLFDEDDRDDGHSRKSTLLLTAEEYRNDRSMKVRKHSSKSKSNTDSNRRESMMSIDSLCAHSLSPRKEEDEDEIEYEQENAAVDDDIEVCSPHFVRQGMGRLGKSPKIVAFSTLCSDEVSKRRRRSSASEAASLSQARKSQLRRLERFGCGDEENKECTGNSVSKLGAAVRVRDNISITDGFDQEPALRFHSVERQFCPAPSPAVSLKKSGSTVQTTSVVNRTRRSRQGGRAGDIDFDPDLLAKLAAHNKKFKPASQYEPQKYSTRLVRQWEKETGRQWYQLSAEERELANDEIRTRFTSLNE